MKRNEDSLRDLWDNIKHNNICIIGVPEGEEREKGPEKIFEDIIVENFPNMGKEISADRGRILCGGKEAPILELEIELYSGDCDDMEADRKSVV